MSFKSPLRALPGYRASREAAMGKVVPEINVVCPAITPTLGGELIINGDMELDSNWANAGTPTTNERSAVQAHSGTFSRHVVADANAEGIDSDAFITITGTWYLHVHWVYPTVLGFNRIRVRAGDNSGNLIDVQSLGLTNNMWSQLVASYRETGGGAGAYLRLTTNNTGNCYLDDASIKPITFSSAIVLLGTRSQRPGTYQCTPTVAAYTQCGMLIGYQDANNFVMAIVSRPTGQAQLIKCIAGVYTSVIAGAIAYGATNPLKVIVAANGTDYSLYYNDVQIGITTAINDAGLGTAVYGFNAYAGNTVGTVTTSGATS